MAEADDLFLGRYVLKHGLVDRDNLLEAILEIAAERAGRGARPFARPLGVVLVTRGHLSDGALVRILSERVPSEGELTASQVNDMDFGSLFVFAGYATREQVLECLVQQRAKKVPGRPSRRLGELMVERGFATPTQVQRLLSYHRKEIFRCDACDAQFNVQNAKPGKAYTCPHCAGPLRAAVLRSNVKTDTALFKSPTERHRVASPVPVAPPPKPPPAPEERAEIDRATALYLTQKNLVRRDALRHAQALQADIARYGIDLPLVDLLQRTGALSWQGAQMVRSIDFAAMVAGPGWLQQAVPGYKVVRKIATGGFATVFAARPVFGGASVALKVLHKHRSAEPLSVARFRNEAALLQQFHHDNIVKCHETGEHLGVHYMALEFVEGESLLEIIRQRGALSVREALDVTRSVAEALRHMQVEGYLHRDVKPDNILVGDGVVKLCDLGLAAPIEERAAVSTAVGTATYVSPEQARGEVDLKAGTDIYALGLVAYFMISGREAFDGIDEQTVMNDRFSEGVKTPDIASLRAPEAVRRLVARMLHPDRARRYTSYGELLGAFPTTP